jgi:hypothetical protein
VLGSITPAVKEVSMAVKFQKRALSPAEASLLAWQFGVSDDDSAFLAAFWVALAQAWQLAARGDLEASTFLARLATPGAFPDEVGVYARFRSNEGEGYWLDILERAGLEDRRQRDEAPPVERRGNRDAS